MRMYTHTHPTTPPRHVSRQAENDLSVAEKNLSAASKRFRREKFDLEEEMGELKDIIVGMKSKLRGVS